MSLIQSIKKYSKMRTWIMPVLLCSVFFISCLDRGAYESSTVTKGQSLAIPLIDSELGIVPVSEKIVNEESYVEVGEDGKLTLFYNGEVVRNTSRDVFPPLPGLIDYELVDTNAFVALPFGDDYIISEGRFGETNIFFRFRHGTPGLYIVKMTLPQMTKDGEVWSKEYRINVTDDKDIFTTLENIFDCEIFPTDNEIQFIYEAYDPTGQRIKMDYVAMKVDQLLFDYIEGYFSKQVFELDGSNIGVGVFEQWISGGLSFEDPKMNIYVRNAFGFPVRSRFNKVELTTLGGQSFELESEFIDKGIDFEYPTVDEIGQVKFSEFSFTKDNSNIKELFNDKVVNVTYDIDALTNPDDDNTIVNFVDTTSFFSVDVNIEVPLNGSANDFVIKSSMEFDGTELADVSEAQFKLITANDFPADMKIELNFVTLDTLQSEIQYTTTIEVGAAPLGSDFKTTAANQQTHFIDLTNEDINRLLDANRLEAVVTLDNTEEYNGPLWLFKDYIIDLKLGAIVKLR